jgi:hypothetical protein
VRTSNRFATSLTPRGKDVHLESTWNVTSAIKTLVNVFD